MRWGIVVHITRNELIRLSRDRRLLCAAFALLLLLSVSFAGGTGTYRRMAAENSRAQAAERERWLNQGTRSPINAGDQGIVVFQPVSPLFILDSGVTSYTGSANLLEGDHENLFGAKPAEYANSLLRMGQLTPARTLQVFVPLLLIFLLYSVISEERDTSLLRQIFACSISPGEYAAGKILAADGLVALIVAGVMVSFLLLARRELSADIGMRAMLIALGYLAYLTAFIGTGLYVSARCTTGRQALLVMLCGWAGVCLLAPPLASRLAQAARPLPPSLSWASEITAAQRQVMTVEERRAAVRKQLLEQYKVSSLRDLPVDPIGAELLLENADEARVYHPRITGLRDIYESQNRFYEGISFAAPLLAIQALSMGLAGADTAAHRHFADAAEEYRTGFVYFLNDYILHDPKYKTSSTFPGTDLVITTAGPEVWARIPPFTYRQPDYVWAVLNHRIALCALSVWFAAGLVTTALSIRRIGLT
jgi:ABC-2 type transport system permease protein